MCQREGMSLQRGMNFRSSSDHSVILMSLRPNAPYRDSVEDGGATLIYEGHDTPRSGEHPNPKEVDQPERTPAGTLTENGKFYRAALAHTQEGVAALRVRVYEKLRQGIWSYNGLFYLVDAWREESGIRKVFRFRLVPTDEEASGDLAQESRSPRRRVIPTSVKLEVWKRDGGRCVRCGVKEELHFDHIIPFSKGGTSLSAANIQLLCARHNLEKHDRIV